MLITTVRPSEGGENVASRWEPPMDDFFKINWDATLSTSFGEVGIGSKRSRG